MMFDNHYENRSTVAEEEREQFCPTCLRRLPSDVTQCPFCGTIAQIETSTPLLLTIAGMTATIASFLTLIAGFLGILVAFSFRVSPTGLIGQDNPSMFQLFTVLTVSNFIGFVLSSIVATNTYGKRGFTSTIMATILLSLVGILNLTVLNHQLGFSSFWAFGFGILVIFLDLVSLVSVTIRKQAFKQERPSNEQRTLVR